MGQSYFTYNFSSDCFLRMVWTVMKMKNLLSKESNISNNLLNHSFLQLKGVILSSCMAVSQMQAKLGIKFS